jgi:hypothetical protein
VLNWFCFSGPWPPEIGARELLTQHKIYFQHSVFLLHRSTLKVCVEDFQNLEKWMSYAFSICYVDNLRLQNGCALWTRNRELITHALMCYFWNFRTFNVHICHWIRENKRLWFLCSNRLYSLPLNLVDMLVYGTTDLESDCGTSETNLNWDLF